MSITLYMDKSLYFTAIPTLETLTLLDQWKREGMVKASVFTPRRHRECAQIQFHSLSNSALARGELSTSRSGRFTPGTH